MNQVLRHLPNLQKLMLFAYFYGQIKAVDDQIFQVILKHCLHLRFQIFTRSFCSKLFCIIFIFFTKIIAFTSITSIIISIKDSFIIVNQNVIDWFTLVIGIECVKLVVINVTQIIHILVCVRIYLVRKRGTMVIVLLLGLLNNK